MSDIVVDSCVVAKWFLPEVDSDKADDLIKQASKSGGNLIVLDLVFPEVSNAIWKRHHRGLITLGEARSCLDQLIHSPVHIEPAIPLLEAAFEIATKHHRSIYDALFVALMAKRGVTGVTADEPLFNATNQHFPAMMLLRSSR